MALANLSGGTLNLSGTMNDHSMDNTAKDWQWPSYGLDGTIGDVCSSVEKTLLVPDCAFALLPLVAASIAPLSTADTSEKAVSLS